MQIGHKMAENIVREITHCSQAALFSLNNRQSFVTL
jgi:hypothetical protein